MSIAMIPVRNDLYAYTMRITLEKNIYMLSFRYNARMGRWVMDILTANEDPLVMGVVILVNQDLLGRFKEERLPNGTFFAININEKKNENNVDAFGNNLVLLYEEVS